MRKTGRLRGQTHLPGEHRAPGTRQVCQKTLISVVICQLFPLRAFYAPSLHGHSSKAFEKYLKRHSLVFVMAYGPTILRVKPQLLWPPRSFSGAVLVGGATHGNVSGRMLSFHLVPAGSWQLHVRGGSRYGPGLHPCVTGRGGGRPRPATLHYYSLTSLPLSKLKVSRSATPATEKYLADSHQIYQTELTILTAQLDQDSKPLLLLLSTLPTGIPHSPVYGQNNERIFYREKYSNIMMQYKHRMNYIK